MQGLHSFNLVSGGLLVNFSGSFDMASGGLLMSFLRLSNCDLLCNEECWEFPAIPVVRTWLFHCCGPGFNPQSLAGELKFHKPSGRAKKKKKQEC